MGGTFGGMLKSASILWRLPPFGRREDQYLQMADGGTVHLSWCPTRASCSTAHGVALIAPGVNTTSRWSYIRHTQQHLHTLGITTVCFDYRGYCAPLTSAVVGSADSWRDLPEIIAAIRNESSAVPIVAIGFSAGGTLLTRYLSEAGRSTPISAAVTVSSPLDLSAFFRNLESSLGMRALDAAIAAAAKLTFLRHAASKALQGASHAGRLNWAKLALAPGMRNLELATIIPLLNPRYGDPDDYHKACSPAMRKVAVPLLSIHAADDPLVPVSTLPLDDMRANENCILVVSRRGGHLGWAGRYRSSRTLLAPTWVDELCSRFLSGQLGPRVSCMIDGASASASSARPSASRPGLRTEHATSAGIPQMPSRL
jgi:predicted alpha/beta-fold hydrolase